MSALAYHLLGTPSRTRGHEFRYGKKGSIAIDVDRGLYSDFEQGIHGNALT